MDNKSIDMKNKEVEKKEVSLLKKSDVVKSFWLWMFFSVSNYNYERLMANGFVHALSPVLKRLYGNDKEKMTKALQRHLVFFNIEPHFGSIVGGITVAMEEQKAQGKPISTKMINSLKTGLMGPLSGIGDTLWQGTLIPITLSFGISFGATGNLVGPLFYAIVMPAIILFIAYNLWMKGYILGKEGVQKLLAGNMLQKVMNTAQTTGAIVLGGLAAGFVKLSSPLSLKMGNSVLSVQTAVLNKLFLGLLPLSITLFTFLLLNKKMKSTTVLLILAVVSGVGAFIGIF